MFAPDGNHLWSTRMDGNFEDRANSVAFDLSGSLAVAGYYWSTPLLVYHSNGQVAAMLPLNGSYGAFVSVFTAIGTHLWSTRISGNDFDSASSVAFDSSGRLLVTGLYTSSQLLIYHATGQAAAMLSNDATGYFAGFVSVFASGGNHLWSTRIDGTGDDGPSSVAFDQSGRLAVAGSYRSTPLFIYHASGQVAAQLSREGSWAAFVSLFASNGSHLWSTRIDGSGADYAQSVAFDQTGRLAVAGYYQSTGLTIYHASGQIATTLSLNGSRGGYVSMFSSEGNHLWSIRLDGNNDDRAYAVALDQGGRLAVAGWFVSTQLLIYHPSGELTAMLPRNGTANAFVSVFASDGNHLWSTISGGTAWSVAFNLNGRLALAGSSGSLPSLIFHANGQLAAILPTNGSSAAFVSVFDSDASLSVTTQKAANAQFTFPFGIDGNPATTSFPSQNTNQASGTSLASWIVVVAVAGSVICFVFIALLVRARKNRKARLAPSQEQTSSPDTATSTTGLTTLQVTKHELSVPAYLEFKFGESFIQDSFIAKGGGGSIYTCKSIVPELTEFANNQPIVVKNLGMSVDRLSDNLAAAFWQEITIMWKFRDHDMFCKVAGFSCYPASIIMRHYQMGDLRHFILSRNKKFPYTKLLVVNLMNQYCKGIAIMHSYDIVHCDIKPANCLLEESNGNLRLIIADFGISRIVSTSAMQVKAFVASTLKGASIFYAAPEVMLRYRGHYVADVPVIWKAGDIFALAVTMLELVIRGNAW
jgi:hypothetical protein